MLYAIGSVPALKHWLSCALVNAYVYICLDVQFKISTFIIKKIAFIFTYSNTYQRTEIKPRVANSTLKKKKKYFPLLAFGEEENGNSVKKRPRQSCKIRVLVIEHCLLFP